MQYSLINRIRVLAMCLVITALAGCGFHLRGHYELAPELQVMKVHAPDSYSTLARNIKRRLIALGVELPEAGTESTNAYSLSILDEESDRRTVSYNDQVEAAEYELVSRIRFEVKSPQGSTVLGPVSVQTERVIIHSRGRLLGEADEEELLRREMQEETAHRVLGILRRLSSEDIRRAIAEQEAAAS